MSQSPYVYDTKSNRPAGTQGYTLSDTSVTSSSGLNGYGPVTGYNQYPPVQQQQQQRPQQSSPQGQTQTGQTQQSQQQTPQAQPASTQGQVSRSAYPYNAGYSQYDQTSHNYNTQLQQMQQQYPQIYQQQPAQQQLQGQSQSSAQQQQQAQPQQQYSAVQAGTTGLPYTQATYLNSAYQTIPSAGYSAASAYAYPYQTTVQNTASTSETYKHQPQISNVSNLGLVAANSRGAIPLQQPGLIDPNQLPQRPKLTTTFWEDEGTVCYQVESRGISVSRREDTNFINGTKLLNVAGMSRGRRDGILKSEKVRYVVKIGAMNLKGVWIPFERALELARNEGIVDHLYPLFVKDIKEIYQGPQFSGGLTAAANSNPKNIIPVTVTNSTYTPGTFNSKEKKKNQSLQQTAQTSSSGSTSDLAPQADAQPQAQQFAYGYPYAYQQVDPQYGMAQSGLQQYKQSGYYGYQPSIPTGADPSKEDGLKNEDVNEKAN